MGTEKDFREKVTFEVGAGAWKSSSESAQMGDAVKLWQVGLKRKNGNGRTGQTEQHRQEKEKMMG